jgi:putative oxidoreductase
MRNTYQNVLNLIGRLLIVALFLPAGIAKLTGFSGTVAYIQSVGLPAPTAAAALALIVEIVGGLALLIGFKTRFTAIVLAIFTFFASIFFHNYWAAPSDQAFVGQLLFFKNVAVIGGLMILAASGAGKFSMDGSGAEKS